MKSNALVSVVIPVYNGEAYLAEALASVVEQSYRRLEIIVVDDGSADRSPAIAAGVPGVRYFFQPNSGTASARNRGIQEAAGDFLAFLDQDDKWARDKLEVQLAAFGQQPEPHLVFGHVQQFLSPDLDHAAKVRIQCPSTPMPGYSPSAMLATRAAFLQVGLFDTRWQVGEWTDWCVRATDLGLRIAMLPDVVAWRRLHARNKGIVQRRSIGEYALILKGSLDRRRARTD